MKCKVPSQGPQGAFCIGINGIFWNELSQHCLLQCFRSISAVCEVWKQLDKGIGHRSRALCFKGIGEIPTYTICTATKLQRCNYVNNSNQGCV